MPEALAKSEEARKVANADTVLQQMVHLRDKALGILDRSEEAEDSKTALQAIREARSCVELIAKIRGELDEKSEEDSDLVALRELVDQVRAHSGDMPRGSLTLEKDGSGDGYAVVLTPNPLQTLDD